MSRFRRPSLRHHRSGTRAHYYCRTMSPSATPWTCYLTLRLLLSLADLATDLLQSASLFSLGHPAWGSLTLLFPFMAVAAAWASVAVGRCRHGWRSSAMSCGKASLLALRSLATLCEGLFESGPELVLQAVVVLHGVHQEDYRVLAEEERRGSVEWFRGLLHVLGIATSLVSIIATLIYYNEERCATCRGDGKGGDPWRFTYCVVFTVLSVLFRVFLGAVLFCVTPFAAAGLCLSLYSVNFLAYGLTSPGGWPLAAVAAYASLFSPSGYSKSHGHHSSVIQEQERRGSLLRKRRGSNAGGARTAAAITLRENYSEVERAKINQESLVKRIRLSHSLFAALSLAVVACYVALLEVYLFGKEEEGPDPRSLDSSARYKRDASVQFPDEEDVAAEDDSAAVVVDLIPQLRSRAVLYSVPAVLLALLLPSGYLFYRRVRIARDAARQWFAITPHRNRNQASGTAKSSERRPSYTQQLRAEEEESGSGGDGAIAFHRGPSSEASTVVVGGGGRKGSGGDNRPAPIIRPSAPSLPESLPPPYDASASAALPHHPNGVSPSKLYPAIDGSSGDAPAAAPSPLRHRPPPGTSRCGSPSCVTCELFAEGAAFRSEMTGRSYRFVTPVGCRTAAVVYLVTCSRCKKQYVGRTEQCLRQRHYGHRREIEQASTPLGRHFAEDCGYASWRMQIIDHCPVASDLRRREGYWIKELMTAQPWGLNSKNEAVAENQQVQRGDN